MTDRRLREMVRKIAAQTSGAGHRLSHPWVAERAEQEITDQTSAEDLVGHFLAAVNRCYLEPAAMLLWLLDQTLDPGRLSSHRGREYLRWLAQRRAPLSAISSDQLTAEIAAALTAEVVEDVLADPAGWPES